MDVSLNIDGLDERFDRLESMIEDLGRAFHSAEQGNLAKKEVFTTAEVSRYVDKAVAADTVRKIWIMKQGLPAFKKGNSWYVRRVDLEKWLIQTGHPSSRQTGLSEGRQDIAVK